MQRRFSVFSHSSEKPLRMTMLMCWLVQIETIIKWIAMTFCTGIRGPPRMNYNNCGDPSTFHRAASSGQNFNVCNTLVYVQIPEILMAFPLASVVLYVLC